MTHLIQKIAGTPGKRVRWPIFLINVNHAGGQLTIIRTVDCELIGIRTAAYNKFRFLRKGVGKCPLRKEASKFY